MSQERNEERMDLDQLLAEMAQETPEMPADFHARWTEAVRAEAGQAENEKRQDSRRQWRYILSAAAAFVFLIGGTLLTRSMEQKDRAGSAPVQENAAVQQTAMVAETAAGGAASEKTDADTGTGADFFAAVNEMAGAADQDASAPAAEQLYMAVSAKSAKTAEAAVKADMAEEEDIETAVEADSATEAMEKPSAETAGAAAEETAEEAEASAEPEETGESVQQESEFASFLKDLGIFTLKSLAAAAVIAAVVFGVRAVLKARKK